jgi:hypothetical protein
VDDYVLEEALYREGLALGVDLDDTIIRRRVRQKMEFVVDDVLEMAEPTEAELLVWLTEHADSYARPGRFTFRQVYLNADRRGEALEDDARLVLEKLRSDEVPDPRELGDGSLLEHGYEDVRADTVARTFGQAFVAGLAELPVGVWSGPVESAFGLHLVFVDFRTEGRLPELDEVREEVERDWSYARREEASRDFYEELLSRYQVTVEWPLVEAHPEDDAQAEELE